MDYRDFTFKLSDYGSTEQVEGTTAVLHAIKTLILAKPGNFPFTPKAGVDIGKYQFDLLDDITIAEIKRNIINQITEYIPSIDSFNLSVNKVEDTIRGELVTALGISVSATTSGEYAEGYFLILKDKEVVSVYDEINS